MTLAGTTPRRLHGSEYGGGFGFASFAAGTGDGDDASAAAGSVGGAAATGGDGAGAGSGEGGAAGTSAAGGGASAAVEGEAYAQQVVFEVARDANTIEIKGAVEKLFNVKVTGVRTLVVRGKEKRVGRFSGRRPSWKKAFVTLKAGDNIEFFEGV